MGFRPPRAGAGWVLRPSGAGAGMGSRMTAPLCFPASAPGFPAAGLKAKGRLNAGPSGWVGWSGRPVEQGFPLFRA
jgi:hypothetical protein